MSEVAEKRTGPKWEQTVKDRLKTQLRRYMKPLTELVERDANEGDTRLLVTDLLCDALGYDKYSELTTEYRVKGEFADYGIRLDKQLDAFIEVKRCATKLNQRHLRQVEMYAVNEGVEWLILTNGAIWQVYRLIPGLPVSIDMVIEVDLLDDTTINKKVEQFFYITRESFGRRQIDDVWAQTAATAPEALTQMILSEKVLDELRRELKRQTGRTVDSADLGRLLRETVIRTELTK